MTYLGRRMPRDEGEELLTGRGHYVSDMRLPGMAQLSPVRSPYAYARIRHINVKQTWALPGVNVLQGYGCLSLLFSIG